MSEDLFKLFDEVKARYEGHGKVEGCGCKHPNITDGVCDACWEVLWYECLVFKDLRPGEKTSKKLLVEQVGVVATHE